MVDYPAVISDKMARNQRDIPKTTNENQAGHFVEDPSAFWQSVQADELAELEQGFVPNA